MNHQTEPESDPSSDDGITDSSAKKSTRFPVKKFVLCLLGLAVVTGMWFYLRESARQQERRNLLEQPQEDIESANQTDDSHPLDPILKIAYQSIKKIEDEVADYTAVLSRRERIGEQEMPPSTMEVKIRNPQEEQAFSIYVKFTEPENTRGREVIWVDGKNENKIVAHEAGILGFVRVVQAPDSFVAMVGNRYPITETGLLRLMQKLTQYGLRDRKFGDCEVEILEEIQVADVSCTRLRIIHAEKQKPFTFHIAEIDMDMQRMIPVRLATWDWPAEGKNPALIEEYIYHNIKLNVGLRDADFDPDNPAYNYPK